MQTDYDVSGLDFAIKLIVAADVDGDGRDELVLVPDAVRDAGNHLWVMDYDTGIGWRHLTPDNTSHPMDADAFCSELPFAASILVAADVDGDGKPEVVVKPLVAGSAGNDLWVLHLVPPTRVSCANHQGGQVTGIGGVHQNGTHWDLPEDQAIAEIQRGRRFYVEEPTAGARVPVVIRARQGNLYLTTLRDNIETNNLSELPECP
jgi:hypothetical protein